MKLYPATEGRDFQAKRTTELPVFYLSPTQARRDCLQIEKNFTHGSPPSDGRQVLAQLLPAPVMLPLPQHIPRSRA